MVNLKKATVLTLVVFSFFVIAARSQPPDNIYTISKGLKIRVRMDNEINSRVSSVNDTFTVTVASPVYNRGIEVLPVGTLLEGRILRVKKASIGKKPGNFEIRFETLFLPEEAGKRKIDAVLANEVITKSSPAGNVLTVAGATAAGGLLGALIEKSKGALIGAGAGLGIGTSYLFFQKGEEARIKANEEFDIIFRTEVKLPSREF